jgi:hypothetical protein
VIRPGRQHDKQGDSIKDKYSYSLASGLAAADTEEYPIGMPRFVDIIWGATETLTQIL